MLGDWRARPDCEDKMSGPAIAPAELGGAGGADGADCCTPYV